MKYEYSVKYCGTWYKPGEELPEEEIKTQDKPSEEDKTQDKPPEEVIENDKRTGGKPKPRNTDKG